MGGKGSGRKKEPQEAQNNANSEENNSENDQSESDHGVGSRGVHSDSTPVPTSILAKDIRGLDTRIKKIEHWMGTYGPKIDNILRLKRSKPMITSNKKGNVNHSKSKNSSWFLD